MFDPKELSGRLALAGFVRLEIGAQQGDEKICAGTPRTYDSNNGVTVVVDETGTPWVCPSGRAQISTIGLVVGAYVPHSNGGGWLWSHFART